MSVLVKVNGEWQEVGGVGGGSSMPWATALGGTESDITDPADSLPYRLHRFDANGTLLITTAGLIDQFIVGGGQGGGSEWHPAGQGGGVLRLRLWVEPGTFAVVIGNGGGGGCKPGDWTTSNPGASGGASSIGTSVAPGGNTAGATGQGTVSTFTGVETTYAPNGNNGFIGGGGPQGVQCGQAGARGVAMARYGRSA